jgi:hypothetical protein
LALLTKGARFTTLTPGFAALRVKWSAVTALFWTSEPVRTDRTALPENPMLATVAAPEFTNLSPRECEELLQRNNVGRIAMSFHDRVDIQPINYVRDGHWLFGRTSSGSKIATMLHNPWCAFEVDEVRGAFDWSSVVIKGTFSILDKMSGSLHTYQRADLLLRKLVPGTFSSADPVGHRDVIFGIFAREITGRASHT